jgi:hypothetical protein
LEGLLERTRSPEKRADLEDELRGAPLPEAGAYLWRAFLRLSARRGSNGFGPSALAYHDIAAFERLTRFSFTPWEVEMIEALDGLYLADRSKKAEERTKRK